MNNDPYQPRCEVICQHEVSSIQFKGILKREGGRKRGWRERERERERFTGTQPSAARTTNFSALH